jgi:hypothetical protein
MKVSSVILLSLATVAAMVAVHFWMQEVIRAAAVTLAIIVCFGASAAGLQWLILRSGQRSRSGNWSPKGPSQP